MSEMWMMRGVSKEARRLARVGSLLAGVTMGEWLSVVIVRAAKEAREAEKKSEEAGVEVRSEVEEVIEAGEMERVKAAVSVMALEPAGVDFDDLVDQGKPAPELDEEIKPPTLEPVLRSKGKGPAIQKKAKAEVKARAEKNSRKCAHGMKAEFNCWQCGGIARPA